MNRDLLYSKKFIVFQKKLLNRSLKQARYNKGKEINNSILEAEKKRQEATEQGKTALEIESAKALVKQLRKANKVK